MKKRVAWAALVGVLLAAAHAGAGTMTIYLDSIDGGSGTFTNPSNFALYLPVSSDFTFSNFSYGPLIPNGWRLSQPSVIPAGVTGAVPVFAFGSLTAGIAMPYPVPATPISALYAAQSPTVPAPPAPGSTLPTILAVFDYQGTITTPANAPGYWAIYGPNGNKQAKMLLKLVSASRIDLSTLNLPSTPPVANAGADQAVAPGATVTLNGSGSTDSDGTLASYQWTQDSGTPVTLSNPTAPSPTFTAPAGPATLHFRLTVADNSNLLGTATVTVTVTAPVADAGPTQTVAEGVTVTLDGSNSHDTGGTIASYQWGQTAGPSVTLSDPTVAKPNFLSPLVGPSGTSLTFQLTVTDNVGASASATTNVNVSNVNQPPVANAGPTQTVAEGALVTLDGSNSSDPDGTIASYAWTQTAGPSVTLSDPAVAKPTFTAPAVGPSGTSLTFQLTVTDDGGLTGTATTTVNVSNVNQPPVANAGPTQTVAEGALVTLDGSNSSDPDGTIASYAWTQTAGPSVTLSDPAVAKPTFTAPAVGPSGTSLTFQLTVTDDGGLTGTATTTVNVSNVNQPPVANAGPTQTVAEGALVTLDGSNSSDPDGSIASYAWTQTAGPSVTLSNPAVAKPTFTAPAVGLAGGSLTFQLTVTDDGGLTGTAVTIVNVSDTNRPPLANAGPDQTVSGGALVTLDGSRSSDSDGTIATYLWEQTGGPSVTLSNPRAVKPTFTAPSSSATLTFKLTVTDDGTLGNSATTVVTVESSHEGGGGGGGPCFVGSLGAPGNPLVWGLTLALFLPLFRRKS